MKLKRLFAVIFVLMFLPAFALAFELPTSDIPMDLRLGMSMEEAKKVMTDNGAKLLNETSKFVRYEFNRYRYSLNFDNDKLRFIRATTIFMKSEKKQSLAYFGSVLKELKTKTTDIVKYNENGRLAYIATLDDRMIRVEPKIGRSFIRVNVEYMLTK